MRCSFCGIETRQVKIEKYQYKLSGVLSIFLKNILFEKCDSCDLEIPIIPKIVRLHETIARALVLKPSLLTGDEIRFLRKNLRMKSQDWAKFLRKDVSHISRAERDGQKVNKDLDLLIRLAFIRLWEEKRDELFRENLPVLESAEQGILIDVEEIEKFTYFNLEEIWERSLEKNFAKNKIENSPAKPLIVSF